MSTSYSAGEMKKTSVYLTSSQKRALALAATVSGRPQAELIREGVDAVISRYWAAIPTLPLFASNQPDLAERVGENLEGFGRR